MKSEQAGDSRKRQAYKFIQNQIVSGSIEVGQIVSEAAISKAIGISRTPVREAIAQLAAEGFLEQIAGRGTIVKLPQRSDILELYELREALEVYAVGKMATPRLDGEDFAEIERSCDALPELIASFEGSGRRRLNAAEMDRLLNIDLQFHLLLLRAAGNRRMLKVVRDTRLLIRIFALRHEGHDVAQLRQIEAYHRGILEAVRSGDAPRAMSLLGEHIRKSRQERLEEYDRAERVAHIDMDELMGPPFKA